MAQMTIDNHGFTLNKKRDKTPPPQLDEYREVLLRLEESEYELQLIQSELNRLNKETEDLIFKKVIYSHRYTIEGSQTYKYRKSGIGHIMDIFKFPKRVMTMTFTLPTPFIAFKNELSATFNEGLLLKIPMALLFTFSLNFGGFSVEQLTNGFIFLLILAICDGALGIFPNAVKDESKLEDHKVTAKTWIFAGNLIAITAGTAAHSFFSTLINDPNILQNQLVNCHYYVIGFIGSTYVYRITKYVASMNNTKIPNFITNLFKK